MVYMMIYIISALTVYLIFRNELNKNELQDGVPFGDLLMIFTPFFNSLIVLIVVVGIIIYKIENFSLKTTKGTFFLIKKK